jgi:hypothetical protein
MVVNNGDLEETNKWAADAGIRFPVLAQEKWTVSKRYQVFATPFAFLLDEKGRISSKGLIGNRQHLSYVLTGAGRAGLEPVVSEQAGAEGNETGDFSHSVEVTHV